MKQSHITQKQALRELIMKPKPFPFPSDSKEKKLSFSKRLNIRIAQMFWSLNKTLWSMKCWSFGHKVYFNSDLGDSGWCTRCHKMVII